MSVLVDLAAAASAIQDARTLTSSSQQNTRADLQQQNLCAIPWQRAQSTGASSRQSIGSTPRHFNPGEVAPLI